MLYEISNYALSAVTQDVGGELISLKDRSGREYIWQGDARYWGGHAPVLFPICGSLRDNQGNLRNGKTTKLPRHGFARKMPFACDFSGDGRVQFTLVSNDETYSAYPYLFSLTVRHELLDASIRTEYKVMNTGEEDMPFFIGGHPGFCCPMGADGSFEDYHLEFEHEETCTIPTPITETGLIDIDSRKEFLKKRKELTLSHEMFAEDAIILDELHSRRVNLTNRNHTHGAMLEFMDFPYLILWSAGDGAFVAMEPWSGLSTCNDEGNQLEEKRNVMILAPGESRTYSYKISIL